MRVAEFAEADIAGVNADADDIARIVMRLQTHGVNMTDPGEATLREVESDGVFPDDFYKREQLASEIRALDVMVEVVEKQAERRLRKGSQRR